MKKFGYEEEQEQEKEKKKSHLEEHHKNVWGCSSWEREKERERERGWKRKEERGSLFGRLLLGWKCWYLNLWKGEKGDRREREE